MTANRDRLAHYRLGLSAVTGRDRQAPLRAARDASPVYFPRVALPTTDSGSNETGCSANSW
jgi:hypothetical protein